MKKLIMCFSFILACILTASIFSAQGVGDKDLVRAKSLANEKMLIVVGMGEVEVLPDTIQINFGIKTRADTLADGQLKMKENIDNVSAKIKEYDENSTVYISYSSYYPVSEGGILVYEFDCNLIAKSTKVNSSNDLIDLIINAGATSVHHTSYSLTNKEDSYVQALVKAKENANKKVEAMYENATFMGLKEESIYNYCENSRGDKIKVCARVKAFYELADNTNTSATTFKDETKTEEVSKTSQQTDKEVEAMSTDNTKKTGGAEKITNKVDESVDKAEKTINEEESNQIENKANIENTNEIDNKPSEEDKLNIVPSSNMIVTADNSIVRNDNISTLEERQIA